MTHRWRVMLTSLSPTPQDAKYFLGEKTANAKQSPLALIQLLPQQDLPEKIIVLCTDEIRKEQFASTKKEILAGLEKRGVRIDGDAITDISIPNGETPQELWVILRAILDHVPQGVNLTLDVTHGFRSFPFIFFTAAVFLIALRDVEIDAVYYGMLTKGQGPMVDLSLILDMVEWFYATRVFKETGQAHHLNELLAKLQTPPKGVQGHALAPYSRIKGLRGSLNDFTTSYTQALPLELGLISAQVMHQLYQVEFTELMQEHIPVPRELMDVVSTFIEPFALPLPKKRDQKNKVNIPLHENELQRQVQLINSYLSQGYLNYAIGLMREWMVSAVLMNNLALADTNVGLKTWLDYGDRKPIEAQLNYLAEIMESENSKDTDLLTNEQRWLGSKWATLRNKRNQLAHHGHRMEYSLQSANHIKEVQELWNELTERLCDRSWWQLGMNESAYETLLVSPLGLSKGLLFSALKHIQPHRAVVITSQQSVMGIQEIVSKAGWEGELTVLKMKEPFTGFDEAAEMVHELQPMLWVSKEVVINITGGTTAMQYVVQEVAENATRQQIPLKMMALVDRRSPTEQKLNPYILGEIVWLKNKKNEDAR